MRTKSHVNEPRDSKLHAPEVPTVINGAARLGLHTADSLAPDEERENAFEDSWWSASRAQHRADEKTLMARYFVRHHFLVREGETPEAKRETVATIAANQGTTPNCVASECLNWVAESHKSQGPFFLTWYTPGHVIPTTLRNFKDKHWPMRTAAKLSLFPGEVDDETESVSGPDAEEYAERVRHRFKYALLSGYSFDVSTGDVYFYLRREVRLQKACANMFAAHKFLFFDSSKLKREGEVGYNVRDLLATADTVTIYTVSSTAAKDDNIEARFKSMCAQILRPVSDTDQDSKALRLQIVGREGGRSRCVESKGVIIA